MPAPGPETYALSEFKQFIYSSYGRTHPVFADESESESSGRSRLIETLLRKALPDDKNAPILDFGCGDGLLLSIAQKLGYHDLVGVDLSKDLIERASQRTSAKLRHGNGLDFLKSSPDQAFEAITAFDVFSHLTRTELLEACRQIIRTLRPGGRLLLLVPNGNSPFCGTVLAGDLTHERPYTKTSLMQILLPLGFEDIQAMEVPPLRHGLKSTVRAALWTLFRAWAVLWLAAETGYTSGRLLTLNIFVTARKPAQ